MSDKSDKIRRISLSGPLTKETLLSLRAALEGIAALTLDIDALPELDRSGDLELDLAAARCAQPRPHAAPGRLAAGAAGNAPRHGARKGLYVRDGFSRPAPGPGGPPRRPARPGGAPRRPARAPPARGVPRLFALRHARGGLARSGRSRAGANRARPGSGAAEIVTRITEQNPSMQSIRRASRSIFA